MRRLKSYVVLSLLSAVAACSNNVADESTITGTPTTPDESTEVGPNDKSDSQQVPLSAADIPTCEEQFDAQQYCEEADGTCTLVAGTAGESCTDYCKSFGQACEAAASFDGDEPSCESLNPADCDDAGPAMACTCSKKYDLYEVNLLWGYAGNDSAAHDDWFIFNGDVELVDAVGRLVLAQTLMFETDDSIVEQSDDHIGWESKTKTDQDGLQLYVLISAWAPGAALRLTTDQVELDIPFSPHTPPGTTSLTSEYQATFGLTGQGDALSVHAKILGSDVIEGQ